MEMLIEGRTGTGFTVQGESVMLTRYGDVYPTIDNLMHPNPGTESDEYSEIERSIDWLYLHDFKAIRPSLDEWVKIRVAVELSCDPEQPIAEIIHNVFYDDTYTLSNNAKSAITEIIEDLRRTPSVLEDWLDTDELPVARKIAEFINEKFLRVRAGGKLNPEGADAIYFRISSHGYDWHRVIVDFLWDIFKEPSKMPRRIWIGTDLETNPPEKVYYDGTPEDLFDKFDEKIFESDMSYKKKLREAISNNRMNEDRATAILNKNHALNCRKLYKSYSSFN